MSYPNSQSQVSQNLYVYEISLVPSPSTQLDLSPLISGVANMFNDMVSDISSALPVLGTVAAVAASSMLLLGILCIKRVTDRIPIVGFICKELESMARII